MDAVLTMDAGIASSLNDDFVAAFSGVNLSDAEADALIYDVAWNEGWPLIEGERVLFATRWENPGGSVSVVSDVNNW
ncbi:MAG: hypothetical protein GY822_17075 [Deltaproteobacteria bacterium]|nr:hypothetical protein [Deltaproteobacteria bacterium]